MISGRDVAFIGCRFVAIYFAFKALSMVAYIVSVLFLPSDSTPLYSFLLPFTLFGALGWAFWSGARWLSERISAGTDIPDEKMHWSRDEAVSVGLTLLGVALLVFTLARVPGFLANLDAKSAPPIGVYFDMIIFLIASLLMIFRPIGIARFLNRVRRSGKQS